MCGSTIEITELRCDMAKLKCPKCSNNKTWKSVDYRKGKYKAVCAKCNAVVEGTGGIEVDTVLGEMNFNF